jgi:hypothetical protein
MLVHTNLSQSLARRVFKSARRTSVTKVVVGARDSDLDSCHPLGQREGRLEGREPGPVI